MVRYAPDKPRHWRTCISSRPPIFCIRPADQELSLSDLLRMQNRSQLRPRTAQASHLTPASQCVLPFVLGTFRSGDTLSALVCNHEAGSDLPPSLGFAKDGNSIVSPNPSMLSPSRSPDIENEHRGSLRLNPVDSATNIPPPLHRRTTLPCRILDVSLVIRSIRPLNNTFSPNQHEKCAQSGSTNAWEESCLIATLAFFLNFGP